jgi:uncharacterized protein (TIGR02145 family)
MPCPSTIYCISNTGVPLYNDSYEDTLTNYNGVQYYTGQTNGLFIYYSSGDTQWCLSDSLGGTCYLSGKSPCSTTCPDLCDELFTTGSCPTPTPTPTNNCSSLDFQALFDCDLPPTPSVTPTSTVTPTVTVTPTSTNICPVSFIDAEIFTLAASPTPTPTMTPTPSIMVERDCTFSGAVTFDMINDDIVCPFSYEFQECFGSGRKFYTFDTLETPSGGTITQFMVFYATVNGENMCIHYIGFNNQISGTDHIVLLSDSYGFANKGECNLCDISNTPTPTPTPTITPTITLTPSITPTITITQTITNTPSITPTKTSVGCTNCITHDVVIGTQTWAGCNLNVTTFRNGTPIPQITDAATWANTFTPAWCYYNFDPSNEAAYGKLYNVYAVISTANGGIAPTGYHIPTDAEWTTLTAYLGGGSWLPLFGPGSYYQPLIGGKLKEIGNCHWTVGGTDTVGFTALPGGEVATSGYFVGINVEARFATTSIAPDSAIGNRWSYRLSSFDNNIVKEWVSLTNGISVRLIKN